MAGWFRFGLGKARKNQPARPRHRLRLVSLEDRLTPAATIINPGFETPVLATGTFRYQPTGASWTFIDGAGISANGSAFTSGNASAPQGSQVGILQQTAVMRQAVNFTAGTHVITFQVAQRGNAPSKQTFRVLVDSTVVGNYNTITGSGYGTQLTSSFTVAAGSHTITFQGTNFGGGDNTVFIDNVQVVETVSSLTDSGFEQLALQPGQFRYNPSGTAWAFSGGAGVSSNNSGFTSGNAAPPQASQVLFLQGGNTASQSVNFAAGTYALQFAAAQRGNAFSRQTFRVLVDGIIAGTFNDFAATSYVGLFTGSFTLNAGLHTVQFQSTNLLGGDNTIFIDQVSVVQATTGLNDSGFESLGLPAGQFRYRPTGTPWTFNGSAGISANNSGFTSGNFAAPQGSQVAFLQQTGSFSQNVGFNAGTYTISFLASQRGNLPSAQTFRVFVDGVIVGTFNNLVGNGYSPLETSSFSVATGNHLIEFQGTNLAGGDNTAFIDALTINAQAAGIVDSGFERPPLTPGTFTYTPPGSPWVFTGESGVTTNGSGFTQGGPIAPQGFQNAFLQRNGSFGQVANFAGGSYRLFFLAAQRLNIPSLQTFAVLVDGVPVLIVNNFTGTNYTQFVTDAFTVGTGNHTITFQGTNAFGGDNTVFIDVIQVAAV